MLLWLMGTAGYGTSKLLSWYPRPPEVTIIITGTTIIAAILGGRISRVMSWFLCYSGMNQFWSCDYVMGGIAAFVRC